MRDPIPPPSSKLFDFVKPYADALYLPTLPYHIHEVIFAYFLYQITQSIISPTVSSALFPDIYPKLSRRTRINWDVHVVSLVQSLLINTLALWVMFTDEERRGMENSHLERVYGYTGASGLIQGLAAGYFLWDLVVSTRYLSIFGPGIWAHSITALVVFAFGFRPFCNYYGPVFILYELSSPFLNVHWFCDKLNMTGSKLQWYNGMILLATFFGCRLVWGTYQSLRVYQDVWYTMHLDTTTQSPRDLPLNTASSIFTPRDGQLCLGKESCLLAQAEVMKFAGSHTRSIPLWLAIIYLACNVVLNFLNFFWFGKMVETVRKRFSGQAHDEFKHEREGRRPSVVEEAATGLDHDTISGPKTPPTEKSDAVGLSSAVPESDAEISRRRKDLS